MLTAFLLCETIGCPHPRFLESKYDVTWSDLVDWQAFLLWKHGASESVTDSDKAYFLEAARQREKEHQWPAPPSPA